MEWLRSYLLGPGAGTGGNPGLTVLMTSHDRTFMDDVCTDIILFKNLHLHYYPGNYSDFEKTKKEKDLGLARNQELIDKQRKHVEDTIQRMQVCPFFHNFNYSLVTPSPLTGDRCQERREDRYGL